MHDSASLIVADWPGLLARLAGSLDLEALALETRALVRRRGVPDAKALLRLALARGPGGMSLRQTAAWAQLTGVADLTDASRWRPFASVLRLPRGDCRETAGGSNAFALFALSALAGTALADRRWKLRSQALAVAARIGACIASMTLAPAVFRHLELTDKHGGEALDRGPDGEGETGVEGEIRIADRGYSAAKALRRFMASAQQAKGADYLVRLRWSSLRLRKPHGEKFELIAHLQNMPKDQNIDDIGVLIDGAGAPMQTRIVIARKILALVDALGNLARFALMPGQRGEITGAEKLIEGLSLGALLADKAYDADHFREMYKWRHLVDIDHAWRLSRLCCGGCGGVDRPRRHAAPRRRRGADRLQRRDRLGIGAHQHGALRAAADIAAG